MTGQTVSSPRFMTPHTLDLLMALGYRGRDGNVCFFTTGDQDDADAIGRQSDLDGGPARSGAGGSRRGDLMQRIVVFGNSGSGKTTLARDLVREHGIAHLDLDQLAWEAPGTRMPLAKSREAIDSFLAANPEWVVEGCYGDLIEEVLPFCTELRFLNPGVETCVENCRSRSWEPDKYPSKEAQDENLEFLLRWVREYDTRTDEYSLARHRALFERFPGPKLEITSARARG